MSEAHDAGHGDRRSLSGVCCGARRRRPASVRLDRRRRRHAASGLHPAALRLATPKQYCPLLGSRSTLQDTLVRLNHPTPASRTLTVIGPTHAPYAMPQLASVSDHVFRQPGLRGTGLALYVALAMIRGWNPSAVVTSPRPIIMSNRTRATSSISRSPAASHRGCGTSS